MAIKTPTQLPAADLGAIDDTVVFVIDDADESTRKLTLAELRDALGDHTFVGDVTGVGPYDEVTLTIANGVVTLAKMASIATQRVIGRSSGGAGAPEALEIGPGLSLSGGVLDTVAPQNAADSATLLDHIAFGGF